MTETERQQYTQRYKDTYFRHQDGGIYQFLGFARLSETGGYSVLYTHVWPFTKENWVRPIEEWTYERFSPVTTEYALSTATGNREQGQQQVIDAKSARRNKAVDSNEA